MSKPFQYIYLASVFSIFICLLFCMPASGEENSKANSNNTAINSKTTDNNSSTIEMSLNSSNKILSSEKSIKSQSSDKEKKPKISKKKAIYIFDTIVTGLMHILIAAFVGVIVLIILKWFFLERQIK